MKKIRYLSVILLFTLSAGVLYGINSKDAVSESIRSETQVSGATRSGAVSLSRNDDAVDFSGVTFTPWDVNAASKNVETRAKKPYTIMVYMNGSDLESEDGAATSDLIEILNSGVDTSMVNIVLFTGGTNRWQNDVIPENECMVWEIEDGLLYDIAGVGLVNMGDAGTLSSFIDFGVNNFPADKYGLIMWDHGGGSIAGYGHDEKFNKSNLTLLDLNYAFKRSVLSKQKLEFLGFDSCLMSTAEMAIIASNYANYLIASEDLEPGDGWNYSFLPVFNETPGASGAKIGKAVVDSFMNYYGPFSEEILTLSVTDLSKVGVLADSVDKLMKKCSDNLAVNRATFNTLAKKRNGTKTFGEGSPRDNDCDMVDIGDMAVKLSDMFPEEAGEVLRRLNECVVYNRHNSGTDLKGLSIYYIYGGKDYGRESLGLYAALRTNDEHTRYLSNFFNLLVSGGSSGRTRSGSGASGGQNAGEIVKSVLTLWRPAEGGGFIMTGIQDSVTELSGAGEVLWPEINGRSVCLYRINSTSNGSMYVAPASRNGKACDIVLSFSENSGEWKILGSRNEDGLIIQKGFDEIKEGDKISFQYEKRFFNDSGSEEAGWLQGDEFTVSGGLALRWEKLRANETNYLSLQQTDIKDIKSYTGLTLFE